MRLRDAASLALSAIKGCLGKTLLTILGLGIGVGSVVTVITLGTAGEKQVEREIARLGVDKIWITAGDEMHPLTAECAAEVTASTGVPACAGSLTAGYAALDGEAAAASIAGYDEGMAAVHAPELDEGRLFTASEHAEAKAVCLVDKSLQKSLGGDVLGRRILAGGRRFLVVGVVDSMPMQLMGAGSGMLLLPLNTWLMTFSGGVQELTLAVPTGADAGDLAGDALAALSPDGGYRADTLENEIAAARRVVHIFVMVLACVALVCMLTGAIGVMNVLLVSVRERRHEIGLIKALGGTSGQVGALFLLEAAAYAFLGGILGLILGVGMIDVFGDIVGVEAKMNMSTAAPVLAAAAVLGALFGVAPALRASGMQPVDALRSE